MTAGRGTAHACPPQRDGPAIAMAKPSIVLIVTDTQGANAVGAYGSREARTPHLDALAGQAVTFDRCYTTAPVCAPARAALLTGRYAHNAGAWANEIPLYAGTEHLGQRFLSEGYQTVHLGKWHLSGRDYWGDGVCPSGWDEHYWFDGRRYLDTLSERERALHSRDYRTRQDVVTAGIARELTWAHRTAERALAFLQTRARTNDDRPFLLVVSFDEPHHPFYCPPEYVRANDEGVAHSLRVSRYDSLHGKPAHQRAWAASRGEGRYPDYLNPLYFGMIEFVDAVIGEVIRAVDTLAGNDTWVVFTSDHGDMLGAHGLHTKGAAVYEEVTRVPLIIRPPTVARGRTPSRRRTVTSHIDLVPTLLELAGLQAPNELEGNSLVPVLSAAEDTLGRSAYIEYHRHELASDGWGGFHPMRAIVRDQTKLAIHLFDVDELYDLDLDPEENTNLIRDPQHAQARNSLHDQLIDWMYSSKDPLRGHPWEVRPWRSARRVTWTGEQARTTRDG